MKVLAAALLLVLAALQYRLWVSDDGVRSLFSLGESVAQQQAENETLLRRNEQLAAEVKDLKEGLAALEERARNDLGMIGADETFFQVVEGPSAAPGTALPLAAPAPAPVQQTSTR
ncbi:MAG: cell division protein FtsB [Steroidobacteraceae bacterium]|jgi:cell division protein FtsB|nr:cell division protein FtsB [Steroidobacteraceae bacterium]